MFGRKKFCTICGYEMVTQEQLAERAAKKKFPRQVIGTTGTVTQICSCDKNLAALGEALKAKRERDLKALEDWYIEVLSAWMDYNHRFTSVNATRSRSE